MTTILGPKGLPIAEANAELTWDDLHRGRAGAKHLPGQHDQLDHGRPGVLDISTPAPTLKDPTRSLPTFDLSPGAIDSVYSMCAEHGVTHEAMVAEIEKRIGGKDSAVMNEAKRWYPNAHDDAQRFADDSNGRVSLDRATAVIAALSPGCEWELNRDVGGRVCALVGSGAVEGLSDAEATKLLKKEYQEELGKKVSIYEKQIKLAFKLARGKDEDIDSTLHGLKVRSFFSNISEPGQTREVTIDRHMLKIFGSIPEANFEDSDAALAFLARMKKKPPEDTHSSAAYIAISEAVRDVALRWGVHPDEVQAAYWLQVRDMKWKDLPYDQAAD